KSYWYASGILLPTKFTGNGTRFRRLCKRTGLAREAGRFSRRKARPRITPFFHRRVARLAHIAYIRSLEAHSHMETPGKTLFVNPKLVLDGFAELQKSFAVLVQGSRIVAVSQTHLPHEEAQVIDVRGHTLMPGLIDAHAHITGLSLSPRNSAYAASETT